MTQESRGGVELGLSESPILLPPATADKRQLPAKPLSLILLEHSQSPSSLPLSFLYATSYPGMFSLTGRLAELVRHLSLLMLQVEGKPPDTAALQLL